MAESSGSVRDRARRAYRSLPPSVKASLAGQANLVRRTWRSPDAAPPTMRLPMNDEIAPLESAALAGVLEVLARADLPFFAIPEPEPSNIRLALPAEARADLFDALARGPGDLAVSWGSGRRFHSLPAAHAQRAARDMPDVVWIHRSARAANLADARDVLRGISVEFWEPDGRGAHQRVLPNPYASTVRFGAPMVSTTVRTGHALPTFRAFAVPDIGQVAFPVDVVYLWVDDADPRWRARRDRVLEGLGVDVQHESAADARFRQHDELRYSLRSLSQFAPWVRHVYLVTDQQVPPWLNLRCPRISVVDHTELFAGEGQLPTFNSHALAARLHHIPGISDHFMYMNDDFFFGRRTGAELWFDGNGRPRCYFTGTTADPPDLGDESPLAQARNHTFDLVEALSGRLRRRNLQHGPYAMAKEMVFELERVVPDEFERTWSSQLRSPTDFVPERLYSQVGHAWGAVVDSRGVRYKYFNVGQPEARHDMQAQLDARWADTFCVNDAEGPVRVEERRRVIEGFLADYFPTPSEFEL